MSDAAGLEKVAREIIDHVRMKIDKPLKFCDTSQILMIEQHEIRCDALQTSIFEALKAERDRTARRCAELLNSVESQMREEQEPESNGFGAALIWAENRIKKEFSL